MKVDKEEMKNGTAAEVDAKDEEEEEEKEEEEEEQEEAAAPVKRGAQTKICTITHTS